MMTSKGSLWGINQDCAQAVLDKLFATDAEARASAFVGMEDDERRDVSTTADGTATIRIHGPMIDGLTGWLAAWIGACSPTEIRQAVEAAAMDASVTAITLDVNSPGGPIDGIAALADAVHVAAKAKPVTARISAMCASAAYWVASQASTIEAERTSTIGSLGAYLVVADSSRAAEDHGVKVYAIATDDLKAAGIPGTVIKQEHLDAWQDRVNAIFAEFKSDVLRGRGNRIKEEAISGRVWIGEQARSLGLVDTVTKLALDAETQGGAMFGKDKDGAGQEMQAALDEAKAQLEELSASATVDKAQLSERINELETQNAAQKEMIDQAEARATNAQGEARIAKAEAAGFKGLLRDSNGKLNAFGALAFESGAAFDAAISAHQSKRVVPPTDPVGSEESTPVQTGADALRVYDEAREKGADHITASGLAMVAQRKGA